MADKLIRDVFGLDRVNGEIGIEIEMEGDGLAVNTPSWSQHADGSLRGNSLEYVLRTPCARDEVGKKLAELEKAWAVYGSRLAPSDRCGVHIHINCQNKTFSQVANILGIYYCFEDLLLKYCGEERDGNFFCLGARHAEVQLTELTKMMQQQAFTQLQMDQHYRYAALNITSLAKFGSLEFRPLKTTKSMAPVLDWTNIILCMVDEANSYKSVREIVESCSASGASRFLHRTFGRYAEQLTCKNYDKLIMDGVRRVQEFAYAPQILKNKKKVEHDKGFDPLAAFDDIPAGRWMEMAIGQPPNRPQRANPVPPAAPPLNPLPEAERIHLRALRNLADILLAESRRVDADADVFDRYDEAWLAWHNYRTQLLAAGYNLQGER